VLESVSNDFMYMHTTEDTAENVAWTGLEAGTRAHATIVDDVSKLRLSEQQHAPEGPFRSRLDLTDCAAWVKDSSAVCTPKAAQ
jgi:hypothetical protein